MLEGSLRSAILLSVGLQKHMNSYSASDQWSISPSILSLTAVNSKCWEKDVGRTCYRPNIGWYILWIVSVCLNTLAGDSGPSWAGYGTSVLSSPWQICLSRIYAICFWTHVKFSIHVAFSSLWQGVPQLNYMLWTRVCLYGLRLSMLWEEMLFWIPGEDLPLPVHMPSHRNIGF